MINSKKQTVKKTTVNKIKSNRQILTDAVKNLSDIDLVFAREALITISKQVLDTREQVIKDMEFSFISPHLYIQCSENIYNSVKFKDDQDETTA